MALGIRLRMILVTIYHQDKGLYIRTVLTGVPVSGLIGPVDGQVGVWTVYPYSIDRGRVIAHAWHSMFLATSRANGWDRGRKTPELGRYDRLYMGATGYHPGYGKAGRPPLNMATCGHRHIRGDLLEKVGG